MAVANGMRSVANARPTLCDMLPKELDTEIPAKPRRSISRAVSSAARRRPGVAIRLSAGKVAGMAVFHAGDILSEQARPDPTRLHKIGVPAKAGTHHSAALASDERVPAFAGAPG